MEANGVALEVLDNGKGLPHGDRARLTEPYFTTREKGTGLGLAIVAKVMDDHGGRLVIGDRPGGGACIGLHFLIDPPPEARAAPAATVARLPLRSAS
jgi:two-component system nitrogen regulation sensor histidine kinase NtrY